MDIATLLLEYLKDLNAKSQKSQRKYLLNKGKKRFINNQKEEQYTEYSVIENHLRRISKSRKDRIFPIDNQTLEEFNIKTGEITFTNIEEVQEQIKANNNYIWLKNGNENIYVPKKYYESLKFQVIKSEVKKGDTIERGKVLGFPAWDKEPESNEIPASNPFIDYALFFTENITEKTTTLESINIQKDMECLIENISFTANDKKVFLSPSGCELSTKEISETEDYVEQNL